MHLNAQAPARMLKAVSNRERRVFFQLGAIHRLQRKALECQGFECLRRSIRLREHQLKLVAGFYPENGTGLGTDANPVETVRRLDGAVGFNGYGKSASM